MVNLVRSLSFRRKSKKVVDQAPEQAPPQNEEDGLSPSESNSGKKSSANFQKELEKALSTTIEAPLAILVKTVSAEIVKPLSKTFNEIWHADYPNMYGPLSSAYIDPRDVLSTINIGDITESVKEVLMALIKKVADEYLVPFFEILRAVLASRLGDKYTSTVAWIENLVRNFVPAVLKAVFGDQEETKTAKWVISLTDDLLKALSGPPNDQVATKPTKKSRAHPKAGGSGSKKQSLKSSKKLKTSLEESLEGSLKETLEDFKEHMENALK